VNKSCTRTAALATRRPGKFIPDRPASNSQPATELSGSSVCSAAGITVQSTSPILAICRRLTEAGIDPDRPLLVYRGDTLCLRVRNIGEAGALRVIPRAVAIDIIAGLEL
jgi:hypothetical protein